MLDEMALRWPAIDASKFCLSGFSRGAQFSHGIFFYLHPIPSRYLSWYARKYHVFRFGENAVRGCERTGRIFGQEINAEIVKKTHILCVVGNNDMEGSASKARLLLKQKSFGSNDDVTRCRRLQLLS